ncbi:cardiolipin synthase [Lacticaseibacillus saniviri]|uniref:cardiolipin synthase n=1 Tax=Lacticaseibacillus saniviri TaxID=931533 RepID=UPI001CDA9F2C
MSVNKLRDIQTQQRLGIDQLVETQLHEAKTQTLLPDRQLPHGLMSMINTLLVADGALITEDNHIDILADRDEFMNQLFTDIAQATNHVHLEAYTIEPDDWGIKLRDLLVAAAKRGVRVRVNYDSFGSHRLSQKFWRPLTSVGGQVEVFVATRLSRANLRINFRNHRKIIVIDGQVGYIGGFNIGHSHRGPAISRDTQLRMTGSGVQSLQTRFFMDWNATAKVKKVYFQQEYFPKPIKAGHSLIQIVSGSPGQSIEAIKLGYLRLIALAKHSIWIQTPYFVPDDSLLDALVIAANSGIDVRIMVPGKTNQPTMTRATRYYLDQIVQSGAQVFIYQEGFLHAKTLVVDGRYVATGTANMDVRSFKLNFEVAAFIYDHHVASQFQQLFLSDMQAATPLTQRQVASQTRWHQIGQELSRLLAPIL